MRMLSSMFESRGYVEPMAGLAVWLRTLRAKVRVCAPADWLPNCARLLACTNLLARVDVPLAPMGEWR